MQSAASAVRRLEWPLQILLCRHSAMHVITEAPHLRPDTSASTPPSAGPMKDPHRDAACMSRSILSPSAPTSAGLGFRDVLLLQQSRRQAQRAATACRRQVASSTTCRAWPFACQLAVARCGEAPTWGRSWRAQLREHERRCKPAHAEAASCRLARHLVGAQALCAVLRRGDVSQEELRPCVLQRRPDAGEAPRRQQLPEAAGQSAPDHACRKVLLSDERLQCSWNTSNSSKQHQRPMCPRN